VKVEHHVLWGELEQLSAGLKALGLSLPAQAGGKINTAFVERLNLTIRQGVAFLLRRTWAIAQFTPELALYLQWWRGYYHFARYHESLRIKFSQPVQRKGKQTPRQYRSRTPAMAAGLASRRWPACLSACVCLCVYARRQVHAQAGAGRSVLELISYPLP
jgi:hypothetical protein